MATTETVTAAGIINHAAVMYGSWTAETSAAAHTITLPKQVAFFMLIIASNDTNPHIMMKFNDETDETLLLTGSTGVTTSPADSAGVTITNATGGSGSTVVVASTSLVASGTNQWFAICEA